MESEQIDQFIPIIDQIEDLIGLYYQKKIKSKKLRAKLTYYAKSTGFIHNKCRQQAWRFLVNETFSEYSSDTDQLNSNAYYEQVKMDVIRTLKRFPPNYSDSERQDLQDELISIINKILVQHPELHYYQGYHDICLTFLLVLGKDSSLDIIDSVTLSHLKYFMEPTMTRTRDFLSHLMPLINCINSEGAEFIQRGDAGHVIFALPWFITWYSHSLDDLEIILRLYDLFLVSHFLMPIYLAAQIVDYRAEEIFNIDCDMASLHQYLSSLPSRFDSHDWEEIIRRALYLFEDHPPDSLDDLNQQWIIKCKFIENSPNSLNPRYRRTQVTSDSTSRFGGISMNRNRLKTWSYVALWGVSVTVGGLAMYFYNQSFAENGANFF